MPILYSIASTSGSWNKLEKPIFIAKQGKINRMWWLPQGNAGPLVISIVEPVVLLINIYICLVYSVLYLWFRGIPYSVFRSASLLQKYKQDHVTSVCPLELDLVQFLLDLLVQKLCKALLRGDTVYRIIYSVIYRGKPANDCWNPHFWLDSFCKKLHWFPPMIGAALCGVWLSTSVFPPIFGMSFPRYVASVFIATIWFIPSLLVYFHYLGDLL